MVHELDEEFSIPGLYKLCIYTYNFVNPFTVYNYYWSRNHIIKTQPNTLSFKIKMYVKQHTNTLLYKIFKYNLQQNISIPWMDWIFWEFYVETCYFSANAFCNLMINVICLGTRRGYVHTF